MVSPSIQFASVSNAKQIAVKDSKSGSPGFPLSISKKPRLRTKLADYAREAGIGLLLAEPKYCADNAAMVAGLAGAGQGISGSDAMSLDSEPNLEVA